MSEPVYEPVLTVHDWWDGPRAAASYNAETLPCPLEATTGLASVATRLKQLEHVTQERLINWGYAVCDAALRAHFNNRLPEGTGVGKFPYAETKV
jgi:NTE family protein